MSLAKKIAAGSSLALYNFFNRKPFPDQKDQESRLPVELLLLIFENLPIENQVRAARICKHWFNVLFGLPWVQYLNKYGGAPSHFFKEGFNWNKELRRRETAENNFNEGKYWYETLAAAPAIMHSTRYYLVSSVRGMEVLVHKFYWTTGSSSYGESDLLASYSIDLASETSTQITGGYSCIWVNGVMMQPIYKDNGVNWSNFGICRPSTEAEEENGASAVCMREHDIESDYGMKRHLCDFFRITEPAMIMRVVPNSQVGAEKFLLYSEPYTRPKRDIYNHPVLLGGKNGDKCRQTDFRSFDGILAYWGYYIVTSTERSIEFYHMTTYMVDRVYGLNLDKLRFARVGIHGNIMAYTADDRTIAVWDLRQNKLLTTINYMKRVFGDGEEPEQVVIDSITVHGSKLVLNFGLSVVIDWRTKKSMELPFDTEKATFLPDGSLIVASKSNVARVRFDVDMTQTVKINKIVNGELSSEPVVLNQFDDYLVKQYNSDRPRSLTFLIDEPTGRPSYKGTQIRAVARVTAFWMDDDEGSSNNSLVLALKQLKVPPMTTSAHTKQRCSDMSLEQFKPKAPVFLYERLVDGYWAPCNPFELKLVK